MPINLFFKIAEFHLLVAIFASTWGTSPIGHVQAKATLKGLGAHSQIKGVVNFTESPDGLIVEARLTDIPQPGKHGFYIHQFGSCDKNGEAAGGHYNPKGVKHGDYLKDGPRKAHVGDLGNILVSDFGSVRFNVTLPDVGLLNGKYNVLGRAVLLHSQEDSFNDSSENAGERIACGSIVLTGE